MTDNYDDLIEMPDGSYRTADHKSIQHTQRHALYKPRDRKVKKTKEAMDTVLRILKSGGSITDACQAVNISHAALRYWRINDNMFDEACREAFDMRTDEIETIFYDRAINGVQQEVYHDGEMVGTKTIHDNGLLTKALVARRPEVWANQTRKVEITGKDGGDIKVVTIDLNKAVEELAKYNHSYLTSEFVAMLEADRKLKENSEK